MRNIFFTVFVSTCLLILTACGSSGGDAPTVTLSGTFVDSPVQGLTYATATQSGTTDAAGSFSYIDGETITFSIGDIELGSVTASAFISPFNLDATIQDLYDPRVLNVARFIQSLDQDGNPGNGIVISDAVSTALLTRTVNFNQPPTDFSSDTTVLAIFSDLNATSTFASPRGLRSVLTAIEHMVPEIVTDQGFTFTSSGTYVYTVGTTTLDLNLPTSNFPADFPINFSGVLGFNVDTLSDNYLVITSDTGLKIQAFRATGSSTNINGAWLFRTADFLLTINLQSNGNAVITGQGGITDDDYPIVGYTGLGFHNSPSTVSLSVNIDEKSDCVDSVTVDMSGPNAALAANINLALVAAGSNEWSLDPFSTYAPATGIWWVSKIVAACSSDGSSVTVTAATPYSTYKYTGTNPDASQDAGHFSSVNVGQEYISPSVTVDTHYIETYPNASSTGLRTDPFMRIYEATNSVDWVAVNDDGATNDDAGPGINAGISMPMTVGNNYIICLEDVYFNGGAYSLNINKVGFDNVATPIAGTASTPDTAEFDNGPVTAQPLLLDDVLHRSFTPGDTDCFSYTPL